MPKNKMSHTVAATKIQSVYRGFFSRKKTNIYGASQGKEIEVYLPFGLKNINNYELSYEMPGKYKTTICTSDLFSIQIDHMDFHTKKSLSIPEIVTAPFKRPGENHTNLCYSEEQIDSAVNDFLFLLQGFTRKYASKRTPQAFLRLERLMNCYNYHHPLHPLSLNKNLKRYLNSPFKSGAFNDHDETTLEAHRNKEICFIFEPKYYPVFDTTDTPRTSDAAQAILNNQYRQGKLLVHVQKTFSLSVEDYTPENLSNAKNPQLHNTDQQMAFLKEARARSMALIKAYPLPGDANLAKMLGLLTICTEQMLTVIHATQYKHLHEKADRPVLAIRQILHYIKLNVCSPSELEWFNYLYFHCLGEVQKILGADQYQPDYRGYGGGYGSENSGKKERYNVFFDLFGDFHQTRKRKRGKTNNSYLQDMVLNYGMGDWADLFANHDNLTGRTHFNLQKVITHNKKEYQPLFEARRIGVFTVEEIKQGKSRIVPPCFAVSDVTNAQDSEQPQANIF